MVNRLQYMFRQHLLKSIRTYRRTFLRSQCVYYGVKEVVKNLVGFVNRLNMKYFQQFPVAAMFWFSNNPSICKWSWRWSIIVASERARLQRHLLKYEVSLSLPLVTINLAQSIIKAKPPRTLSVNALPIDIGYKHQLQNKVRIRPSQRMLDISSYHGETRWSTQDLSYRNTSQSLVWIRFGILGLVMRQRICEQYKYSDLSPMIHLYFGYILQCERVLEATSSCDLDPVLVSSSSSLRWQWLCCSLGTPFDSLGSLPPEYALVLVLDPRHP